MKKLKINFILFFLLGVGLQELPAQKQFLEGPPVTDIDGNTYQTVIIGSQTWMVENLAVTRYNDGTEIPLASEYNEWYKMESPAYCWYNNNRDKYGKDYGALYNWHAIYTGKLCPAGWHVPTDEEWKELFDQFGGIHLAAGKLKEPGTLHWISPNAGTDTARVEKSVFDPGFKAFPGGYRLANGTFVGIGGYGYWWSSTPGNDVSSWCRKMFYNKGDTYRFSVSNKYGASVRCVKDK